MSHDQIANVLCFVLGLATIVLSFVLWLVNN